MTLKTDFQVLLNYCGIKKGCANLDEIEDKLLELEDFSITCNIASSELVSVTSGGSTLIIFEEIKKLQVQIFAGIKLCGGQLSFLVLSSCY